MIDDPSADVSPDPAQMLAVIDDQRRRTMRWVNRSYAVLLLTWATAWFVAFGMVWSAQEGGGNPWFRVPSTPAWIVFGVAIIAGIVVSVVIGVVSGRSVRGPSRLAGAMYGWSWSLSMFSAGLLVGGVARAGATPEVMSILSPAIFVLLVGVLYLAGGALWRSPVQYALGVVMIGTAVVATFVGAPTHNLIYAAVGPVAMLVVAILVLRGVLPAEGRR